MAINNLKIAFCISGTFCQLDKMYNIGKDLKDRGAEVIPIFSEKIMENYHEDKDWENEFEKIKSLTTRIDYNKPLFIQIEKLTKKKNIDLAVVVSTGNTLSKIANAISDDNIPFLVKGMQRNNRPVIMVVSTNDALGLNLSNIGKLMNTKNFYFVPFHQDDSNLKPHSLLANYSLIPKTIECALKNEQIQPILDVNI